MSYQVLARKYRPKNFAEVVGQQHVLNSLIHALDQNRLHHAYLFTGTRGVGKTSLARLLAKSINCLNGISSKPCGQCEHCMAIEQGRFVDLIEIDAASRTKVEDTRDILDNVQYMPSQGRYKVYLIDEIHMLSQHSFNALLKTLEEPPEHVKFLLATTDPHKLPITILSRCLQFNLKHITEIQIAQKLAEILANESIRFEHSALKIIAHTADGSMRDALSLTDQSISYSKGQILTEDVQMMLGIVDREMIDRLLIMLLEENTEEIIAFTEEIILAGKSSESLLNGLAECFYYASLLGFNHQNLPSIPCSVETLQAINQSYSTDMLQLYYQLTLKAKEDLHLAPNTRCGLGMSLLRLCAFSLELVPMPACTPEQKLTKIPRSVPVLTKKPDLKALKASLVMSQQASTKQSLPQDLVKKEVTTNVPADLLESPANNETSTDTQSLDGKTLSPNSHLDDFFTETITTKITRVARSDVTIDWYQLSQSLELKGTSLQIVLNSSLVEHSQNIYVLHSADSVKTFITDSAIKKIEAALTNRQGQTIKIAFSHLNDGPAIAHKENSLRKSKAIKETSVNASFQEEITTEELKPVEEIKIREIKEIKEVNVAKEIIKPAEEKEANEYTEIKGTVSLSDSAAITPLSSPVTPAQVIQKQKAQKIEEIYTSLKANPDVQNLEKLGFTLTRENIKLRN